MKQFILIFVLALFGSLLAAQPSIDSGGVLNVSSSQPVLAPNAVFVIYGKNLGPATIVIASPPNYPTTLANTSVTFTNINGGAGDQRIYVLHPGWGCHRSASIIHPTGHVCSPGDV
jgi:hypothetical protein